MHPAVFLDRDGVLNFDSGFVHRIEDFRFLPGVADALRTLAARGFRLLVVTNQSGIDRGFYSAADFDRLTAWMLGELEAQGVRLDGVYHCPHAPESNCDCRKPAPGMVLRAAADHAVDLGRSWLVGDRTSDVEAGRRAGVRHLALIGEHADPPADVLRCDSLAEFARWMANLKSEI